MREEWTAAAEAETSSQRTAHLQAACNIADRAAPYCHARLANTTVNANVRRSITEFSDEELAVIAASVRSDERDSEAERRPH